jgi:hypothetical protein
MGLLRTFSRTPAVGSDHYPLAWKSAAAGAEVVPVFACPHVPMSRVSTTTTRQVPKATSWNTVTSYATYLEAQGPVDHLKASLSPVQKLEIVGWYTRGHHNFSSLHSIVATRCEVIALDALADQARSGLGLS